MGSGVETVKEREDGEREQRQAIGREKNLVEKNRLLFKDKVSSSPGSLWTCCVAEGDLGDPDPPALPPPPKYQVDRCVPLCPVYAGTGDRT